MPPHKAPRVSTKVWKILLRLPADKADASLALIRSQFPEFVSLRKKQDDLKLATVSSEVTFVPQPDEGGLSVFHGEIKLVHNTSVDRLSLPRMRAMLVATVPIPKTSLHLEELKPVVLPAPITPPAPIPAPVPVPVPIPATVPIPVPTSIIDEIGEGKEEKIPDPEPVEDIGALIEPDVPKPVPVKKIPVVNRVPRPPRVNPVTPKPVEPQPPTPAPSRVTFEYRQKPIAPATPVRVFGFMQ